MPEKVFIAVDLGAGSGRVIAAHTDFSTLRLEEVHRFENQGSELPTGLYWNIIQLYQDVVQGIKIAVSKYGKSIVSIGIDTWGCDYGLVDQNGELIGMPHQYRDPRYKDMAELMHERMPEPEIYALTGIRTNFYNTSLHLLAEQQKQSPGLQQADQILFIPDLLAYWLTGKRSCEKTVASTSQLVNPATGDWAWEVIRALNLPEKLFRPLIEPGTIIGPLRREIGAWIEKEIPVIATASHDTAAAVTGIPMCREDLWLSCGTWSIMGIETDTAITSEEALSYGICNDFGVGGDIHSLKNIAGLWLIQECRRQWALDGDHLSYSEMTALADASAPFAAFIDPDDAIFSSPGKMPEKIQDWCRKTGQLVPEDKGATLRAITESLALKYRLVYERFKKLSGREFSTLRAGGGGIQNEALMQATANALGIPVIAGPIEATSCGNVVTQMLGTGCIKEIETGRDLISRSFGFKTFEPIDPEKWNRAYRQFCEIISLSLSR